MRWDLLKKPEYQEMFRTVMAGYRDISGRKWQHRANYEHFWELVDRLYALTHGPKAKLPETFTAPLALMLGWNAGRLRKGLRERPYFHHILKGVFLTWVLKMSRARQLAMVHHDDVEDVPKHCGVRVGYVKHKTRQSIGVQAFGTVMNLTNVRIAGLNKHQMQLRKMRKVPWSDALCKLLDRMTNLYDMRYDAPSKFKRSDALRECQMAWELVEAMPRKPPEAVLALLMWHINLLARQYELSREELEA